MLVLAVDTSGRNGSVALARCAVGCTCEIVEVVDLAGGTFSAQLVPQIATMLSQHGLSKTDIDAFAIVSGPGSFTGLRIGLAAVKALGEILAKPIAAVSLLEVMVQGGKGLAAIDAGRSEVYAAEIDGESFGEQKLLTTPEFLQAARGLTVVAFDSNLIHAARQAALMVEEISRPRADAVAFLGWRKIQAGHLTSPEELEANYIRRADAQISAPR